MSCGTDWPEVPLGDLIVEGPSNGYSPRARPDASGTPVLRLPATTSGRLVLTGDTTKCLDEVIPPESTLWLRPGDLLIQRSNTPELVGTAAIYDGPPDAYIYPDLMMRVRLRDSDLTRWVWRYLNSPGGRVRVRRLAAGSAGNMPKLNAAKLRSVRVPLPPPDEQRRIAAILDAVDRLVQHREAIHSCLRRFRAALAAEPERVAQYDDVVSRDVTVSDLLAEPPRNGMSPSSRGTHAARVLTLSAITGDRFDASASRDALFERHPSDEVMVDSRDVLVCRGNGNLDLVGVAKLPQQSLPGVVFPDTMIALRFDPRRVEPQFVLQQWGTARVRRQIRSAARTTNGTFKINQERVLALQLRIPSLAVQRESVARHQVVERLSRRARDASFDLLREALVYRAFRGEI